MTWSSKARAFWPLLSTAFLADCATKRIATEHLIPGHTPHEVWGEGVRVVLAYNEDAAMGIPLGPWSRPLLALVAVAMLALLVAWYRRVARQDWPTAAALGLIAGGALGNLLDRLRWDRGVVDFIDVGIGSTRFWIFNVADAAIACGAVLLVWRLSRADRVSGETAVQ